MALYVCEEMAYVEVSCLVASVYVSCRVSGVSRPCRAVPSRRCCGYGTCLYVVFGVVFADRIPGWSEKPVGRVDTENEVLVLGSPTSKCAFLPNDQAQHANHYTLTSTIFFFISICLSLSLRVRETCMDDSSL